MGNLKNSMGGRQIVLVSTAGFSALNTGIFWQEAKTKRLFSQHSSEPPQIPQSHTSFLKIPSEGPL
jgi:hypothetical protein